MLKTCISKKYFKKQKGMASIEAVVSIILYLALLSFSLGSFGVVHSGIVNSIAARNYAFDTFNNRTYLKYHRDTLFGGGLHSHKKNGFRLHTITSETSPPNNEDFIATKRYIAFAKVHNDKEKGNNSDEHEKMVEDAKDGVNEGYSFNPVWVKAAYGICLNANCKPE